MDTPTGELPNQPAIHGAEGQFALRRARARAGHVIEQPGEFGRRKVRIRKQARPALNTSGGASLTQRGALGRFVRNSVSARLLEMSQVPVRVIPVGPASPLERIAVPVGIGMALIALAADD